MIETVNHDDFRKLVEEHVLSACAEFAPTYPIQLENSRFKQPDSGEWVSLLIKRGETFAASLSDRYIDRTPGFVQIDVMVKENSGSANVFKLAHSLADSLYKRRTLHRSTVAATFWKKMVDTAPVTGPYFRVMARVFYHYDGVEDRTAE